MTLYIVLSLVVVVGSAAALIQYFSWRKYEIDDLAPLSNGRKPRG